MENAGAGGGAVQITKKGGRTPLESYDGRELYYVKGEDQVGELWRVPVNGGEERLMMESVINANFALAARGIYFIPKRDPDGFSIKFYNFATGQTRRVAKVANAEWGLTVSPDERWILHIQVDNMHSNLMLVENFR